MKKIVFSLLTASALLIGCRDNDDSLLNTTGERYVTQDQLDDLIAQFPERAMNITEGFEDGNNKYMTQYQSPSHARFGYMSVLLGLEHMTNDMAVSRSHYFSSDYYRYLGRNVNSSATEWVWTYYYKVIYNMNKILDNVPESPTEANVKYIKGRALAMRALSYLDLVRLYGVGEQGIPYYSQNVYSNARVATSTVLGYVESDLRQAYTLLQGYDRGSRKDYINQNVVAGIMARLFLETKNYSEAANYAKIARTGYTPMSESDLMDGFDKITNAEWMWGSDIDASTSTIYASFFSHMANRNAGYAGLLGVYKNIDKRLYEKISDTDYRKQWFVGTHNKSSYSTLPDYANVKFYDASGTNFVGDYIYMRASEMYFIEAEAYAQAGNDAQAQSVLFEIMSKRDPSYTQSSKTGADLIEEIMVNKRIELWGEGQNFFDHKRLGYDLDRTYAGTNHPTFGQLNIPAGDKRLIFQIPQKELDANKEVFNP